MPIDTSIAGFTGFYEPPPQEPPVSTRDFLRGFLRGAQAGAASREFKKAKEELGAIHRAREEGGFPALTPEGEGQFWNRRGITEKPLGALQGILGAALGPDLEMQQSQLNSARIAEAQRQTQMASRQRLAQDAYQAAVERDLANAEAEAQAHGSALDDQTAVRIAAKHYLRYGAAMGPGFGGALGGMLGTEQRAAAAELRAKTAEEATAQRAKTATEAEAGRDYRAELAADTRLQIEETRQALATDPNNMANQLKLANLMARWEGLALGRGNLAQREAGTALRENAAVQSAVKTEAQLAEEGWKSKVPLLPGASDNQSLLTPIPRPLTTANATSNQQAVAGSLNAMQQIARVRPLIGPSTIGPAAAISNIVIDRGLANLFPGLASKERASVNETLAEIQASVVRSLRSDSNINKDEREDLIKTVPKPNSQGFWDSPANALNQLESLATGIQQRAINSARLLRQFPAILETYPDEALADAIRNKFITPEEGLIEFRRRRTLAPAAPR